MEERTPVPSSPLHWFPEFWEITRKRIRPQARLMGLSLVVGVISGLGAVVFFTACQVVFHYSLTNLAHYQPTPPEGETERPVFAEEAESSQPNLWMLLLIPTIGGVLSGVLVYTVAPEAEGHGTDAAIAAYHLHQGVIRPRVPLVKILASALTLGTGGSGGREGPIAQIGAGFGSFLGGVLKLRPAERRVLMAAGMGAGVAAIFARALAGALFAAEVLYRSPDFESEVIIPAGLASVMAYCVFGSVFGFKPLFGPASVIGSLTFESPLELGPYLLLGVFVVVLAMIYTRTFYGLTYLFHKLPIRPHFKPAIGAFLSALLAVGLYLAFGRTQEVLSVLAFGYGILQDSMRLAAESEASLSLALVLLAVAVGKMLTTSLTIGSGGSGGVFGPSMVIGGCGGGALGIFLHWLFAHVAPDLAHYLVPHPASFVIVGMAGFFAAAAKTPFSTLVIVSEMTGNYYLLLPTLWVCALAFLLSDEQSIYSSQVESRSRSPAHQGSYVREVLTGLRIRQFLKPETEVPLLHPGDPLNKVIDLLSQTGLQALPVTDAGGKLLGVVSLEEANLALQASTLHNMLLATDLMRSDVTPLHPEDRLDRALELFVESDLLALPVVEASPQGRVVGVVKRADVSSTYLRYVQGVTVRET